MSSIDSTKDGYNLNCFAKEHTDDASEDYLEIPRSVTANNQRVTRFCGATVQGELIECMKIGY